MKQPKVPEYREGEGFVRYMRTLTLFLKDFTMDVLSEAFPPIVKASSSALSVK